MKLRQMISMGALALAGCASAPTHYHTLIALATQNKAQPGIASEEYQFEMLATRIPVQVDQPQIVLRQTDGTLLLMESERWSMPLSDEIHDALSQQMEIGLGTRDLAGMPKIVTAPQLSLRADVRRFDSLPGHYAMMDIVWTLTVTSGTQAPGKRLICSSTLGEPAGGQISDLVLAHQHIIERFATTVAATARRLLQQPVSTCP